VPDDTTSPASPFDGTLDDHLETLDPDPSRAGFQFELSAQHFLRSDPVWAPAIRTVWGWDDWAARQAASGSVVGEDKGIDLVAELTGGGWMAVQVKHRAYIPTSDIDSFVAATAAGYGLPVGIAYAASMLISTADADKIAATGRMKLDGSGCHLIDGAVLRAAAVWWPSFADLAGGAGPARRSPRAPLPHQVAAIADLVAALDIGDRAQGVMACGTGKTLTAQRVAEQVAPGGLIVLAAPTLSLVDQLVCSWLRDSTSTQPGGLTDWIVVGSDRTVGDGAGSGSTDIIDIRVSDLSHLTQVTTDPAELEVWLRSRHRRGTQRIVFTTHASLPILAASMVAANRTAALLIGDEAHRLAGRGVPCRAAVGGPDGLVLPARRRLFMTATPRIFSAGVLQAAGAGGVDLLCMSQAAQFGPEAHRLSFADAAAAGIVCDLGVLISTVTDADVAELVDRRALIESGPDGRVVDADVAASALATAKAIAGRDLRRVITFHATVARARLFARLVETAWGLPGVGDGGTLVAETVSGATSALDRKAALRRLGSLTGRADPSTPGATPPPADRRLLSNARVLGEGVDVPAVDGIVFCDPRSSAVDVAQAVGRATRTAPGKTRGLVVVPVHLPAGLGESDPDPAGMVGAACDDDVWGPVVTALRGVLAHDERLVECITEARWEVGPRSPKGHGGGGGVIEWLPAGVLADLAAAVEARVIDLATGAWFDQAHRYRQWVLQANNAHPADDDVAETTGGVTFKIGKWARRQRQSFKAGALTTAQIDTLAAVPGWAWDPADATWEAHFAALVAEAPAVPLQHEILMIPQAAVTSGGLHLGKWCDRQRAALKAGTLAHDRRARLEAIPGWSWEPAKAIRSARWWHDAGGGADWVGVGATGRLPGKSDPLGDFCSKARGARRAGTLTAVQIAALEAIPGWWWTQPTLLMGGWVKTLDRLRSHVAAHGSLPTYSSAPRLAEWVGRQRHLFRAGRLAGDRAEALEAIPGWSWERGQESAAG